MSTIVTKSAEYANARKVLGDHRKVFDSVADAIKALKSIFATEGFPQAFPVVGARIGLIDVTNEDTIPPVSEWPAEYSIDGIKVAVTFIGARGITDPTTGKESNGAKGFALYPLHPREALQDDESGIAWLWKVIEKEMSHVALRGLRNVPEGLGTAGLEQAAMDMPLTVSDYVEESTRDAMDTTAFDNMWKDFRALLSSQPSTAALVLRLPAKNEVLKGIRSKAFAQENYADLEGINAFTFIGNTMATLIDTMRANAIANGTDFDAESDEIKAWLAGRDTKVFAAPRAKVEADLGTVDFSAFVATTGLAQSPDTSGETSGETTGE